MKKFSIMKMMNTKELIQSTRYYHLLFIKTRNTANPTCKTFIMTLKLTWNEQIISYQKDDATVFLITHLTMNPQVPVLLYVLNSQNQQ